MRRIACIPSIPTPDCGRIVCYDSDHDSLPEIVFSTGDCRDLWNPTRVEFWEHQGWNRFELVHADTADSDLFSYPWWPHRIQFGTASPMAAGDIDGDGLTDLLCVTCHYDTTGGRDTLFLDVITVESPDASSHPCSLTWHYPYERNQAPEATPAYILHDLGGDGHSRILVAGIWIWKNVGDDSNELVFCNHEFGVGPLALGDFGGNGRLEIAGGDQVWENTGDDQFVRVYEDTAHLPGGGVDMFMTNDIDLNGVPEFYVTCVSQTRGRIWLFMYEDESDGGHQFTRTLVDSLVCWPPIRKTASAGGDLDGDGVDECVWTTPCSVRVYKSFGDNDLRKVGELPLSSDPFIQYTLATTIYDVNNDGYNELLLGIQEREGEIRVFEVDAVDLLSPNSGTCSVGDTVAIRWDVNTPPRCDSLSLFLRRDSMWNLQTIATGIPATDTLYRWVVPSGVPDTGRIVVMAYGPGWQYDISDSIITFTGGGVAEGTRSVPLEWSLSVRPNPARGAFAVRYDVPGKWGQWGC